MANEPKKPPRPGSPQQAAERIIKPPPAPARPPAQPVKRPAPQVPIQRQQPIALRPAAAPTPARELMPTDLIDELPPPPTAAEQLMAAQLMLLKQQNDMLAQQLANQQRELANQQRANVQHAPTVNTHVNVGRDRGTTMFYRLMMTIGALLFVGGALAAIGGVVGSDAAWAGWGIVSVVVGLPLYVFGRFFDWFTGW